MSGEDSPSSKSELKNRSYCQFYVEVPHKMLQARNRSSAKLASCSSSCRRGVPPLKQLLIVRSQGSMATRWPPAVRPGLLRVRHNHTDHELRHLHHLPKKPSTPVLRGVSCRLYKSARYASTSPKTAFTAAYPVTRTKNFIFGTTIGVVLVFGYLYVTDTRAGKSTVCEHLNS